MSTVDESVIRKDAEEKFIKWIEAEHSQRRLAKKDIRTNVGPYLLISRESGAGGSEIARRVSEQIGWDLLDKEIIDFLARHYGTPRSLIEIVDEKQSSWLGDLFNSWIDGNGFSSAAYMHRLNQLFLVAAHHGNVVIVGRGARYLLPREGGLSVRILAPLSYRVQQIAQQMNISDKEARKFVEQSDRNQDAFIKENFHRKASDPHEYDLVVNVEDRAPQDAADFIIDATNRFLKKSGLNSIA